MRNALEAGPYSSTDARRMLNAQRIDACSDGGQSDRAESYVWRSPTSLDCMGGSSGPKPNPPPLQVAHVLRGLQARATTVGVLITLEVDDAVHLQTDEALLTSALAGLIDYAAQHGGERLVLRLTSEEPGVMLELEIDGTRLAFQIWSELESPHSPALAQTARGFQEMQAKLEFQHTSETSASVIIVFPVQRVSEGAAAAAE